MFFRLSALGALPSVCCKRKQPLLSRPCPSPSLSSFFPLLALLMILSSGSFLFVPSVYSLPGRRRSGYIAPPGSGFPLLLSSFPFLSSFFLRRQASKQACRQASKQASKQASFRLRHSGKLFEVVTCATIQWRLAREALPAGSGRECGRPRHLMKCVWVSFGKHLTSSAFSACGLT